MKHYVPTTIGLQTKTNMEFMESHKQLARGLLNGPRYKSKVNAMWTVLTIQLNGLGPPSKVEAKWKKVNLYSSTFRKYLCNQYLWHTYIYIMLAAERSC